MRARKLFPVCFVVLLLLAVCPLVFASQFPTLTVLGGSGGTTNPSAGVYANYGVSWTIDPRWTVDSRWNIQGISIVSLFATPSSGFSLSAWLVNGSSTGPANPLVFFMTGDTVVQPVFTGLGPGPGPQPSGLSLTVHVTYLNQSLPGITCKLQPSGSVTSSQTVTDIHGLAYFSELPPGTYMVSATTLNATAYQNATISGTVVLNATMTFELQYQTRSQPGPQPSPSPNPTGNNNLIVFGILGGIILLVAVALIVAFKKHD